MPAISYDLSLKELAVFAPALGAGIAVAYDVGWFVGTDLQFFTVFTLSEHIAFAFGALPLGIAAAFGILFTAFQIGDKTSPTGLMLRFIWKWSTTIVGSLMLLVIVAVALFFSYRSGPKALLATLGITMSLVACVSAKQTLESSVLARTAFSVITALFVALALGIYVGHSVIQRKDPRVEIVLKANAQQGTLMRTGEHGILILNSSSGKLELIRWEDVSRISAK